MINYLINILAGAVAILFVLCPHEFAHAYIAYKNGDPTAKIYGRMTLNPVKHIDPFGFVLFALFGFGWAKPVPINPDNFKKRKLGLFTTAIAGVCMNFIIAFIAQPLYNLAIRFIAPYAVVSAVADFFISLLITILHLIVAYNLYSIVFNLLPLYPLDGFRVLQSFTRKINPVRRFLKNNGRTILIILIVISYCLDFAGNNFPIYINGEYVNIYQYFDVFYYLGWFAREVIGYPITIAWEWILTI